jgi:hypothetical protein
MSIQRFIIVTPKQYEGAGSFDADGSDSIVRVSLGYKDFATGATTVNYDLTNIPGGVILEDAWMVNRENWTGGAVATATISVGTTAAPTTYILAKSVFAGASVTLGAVAADKGALLASPQTIFVNSATPWAVGTIRVQLVVTGANANALTAGKLDLFFELRAASVRP